MIKIVKAQPVPKEQIECANCGSILEYENVDLELHQGYMSGYKYRFRCPVCGVYIDAKWIEKKVNNMENNKNVWVAIVESRRFFDQCQYSYLPEMDKVFGVYSTREKAVTEVWDYFMGKNAGKYEIFLDNYDADGVYIGCEYIFKRVDEKYGGHALYGIDFYLETIEY